jgi:hypothetical protein
MPDPVTRNRWSGNPWEADPERQAASDAEQLGGVWDGALGLAAAEMASDTSADSSAPTQSSDDAYASLVADWPKVPAVVKRHITMDDFTEVYDYWYDHWRNPKRPDDKLQCFDWAQYQLHVNTKRSTGNAADRTSYFQLFVESLDQPPDFPRDDNVSREDVLNRVDITDNGRTIEGIQYLKDSLSLKIPVLVGIRLLWYLHRPNADLTTNHFVVVVGMGKIDGKKISAQTPGNDEFLPEYYFSCYDYLLDYEDRIYLSNVPNLALMKLRGNRRVAQIRKTVPE